MDGPAVARRLRLRATGPVQGVGFRPLAHRLATGLGIGGWVANALDGVALEIEGDPARCATFLARLRAAAPAATVAVVASENAASGAAGGRGATAEDARAPGAGRGFAIRPSLGGRPLAPVPPDLATCADCVAELFDPASRRHRYPFITCARCGPRQSIVRALPYDRARTTMDRFTPCAACRAEYEDPRDRRFHAQTVACAACGPRLALWDPRGRPLAAGEAALAAAAAALGGGRIVAVKGVGGFHLMVDARDEAAVRRLRARKGREAKPLALMAPSLAWVRDHAAPSPEEEALLRAPEAPIVLLPRRRPGVAAARSRERAAGAGGPSAGPAPAVAPSVASGTPHLGVLLPYAPVHHLLLDAVRAPLVATSGNLSDEPLCAGEDEAVARLGGVADLLLVHDRPIETPLDDSVAMVVLGEPVLLRRARGYAPVPIEIGRPLPAIAGVGGHLKGAVALSVGEAVFLSAHLGDLDSPLAATAHAGALARLTRLYDVRPAALACDLHPAYRSTLAAEASGLPLHRVQHHHAHVLACLGEHGLGPPALGVAWDGSGYGPDGTLWGGEVLRVGAGGFARVAHLRAFPLPGGERAVREGRRAALGLLYEMDGAAALGREDVAAVAAFTPAERGVLGRALARGLNAPRTTSAGRLFDAVASLVGLRHVSRFEGEAAMALEAAAAEAEAAGADAAATGAALAADATAAADAAAGGARARGDGAAGPARPPSAASARAAGDYALACAGGPGALVLDWEPMVRRVLEDAARGVPLGWIAARFHDALAAAVLAVAERAGEARVALTGGCFQNRRLLEATAGRLRARGFDVRWHRRVPPNDGGLALGQVLAAAGGG